MLIIISWRIDPQDRFTRLDAARLKEVNDEGLIDPRPGQSRRLLDRVIEVAQFPIIGRREAGIAVRRSMSRCRLVRPR
jgi:hypothetical protein